MEEWLTSHDECPVCRRDYLWFLVSSTGTVDGHNEHKVTQCDNIRQPSRRPCPTRYHPYVDPLPRPTGRGSTLRRRHRMGGPDDYGSDVFIMDDLPPWLIFAGTM